MNGTKVRIVGAVAAATLALTGCGPSDEVTEPPPAAVPAAGQGYACGLLARADVEALFKGSEPRPKDVGGLRSCTWTEPYDNSMLDLSVDAPPEGAREEYDEMWRQYGVSYPAGTSPAREIAGLGDKAYSYFRDGETHVKVLAGDKFVSVAVLYILGRRTLTPEADVARVVTLAEQALGRM
jgi:hypothetical protein